MKKLVGLAVLVALLPGAVCADIEINLGPHKAAAEQAIPYIALDAACEKLLSKHFRERFKSSDSDGLVAKGLKYTGNKVVTAVPKSLAFAGSHALAAEGDHKVTGKKVLVSLGANVSSEAAIDAGEAVAKQAALGKKIVESDEWKFLRPVVNFLLTLKFYDLYTSRTSSSSQTS